MGLLPSEEREPSLWTIGGKEEWTRGRARWELLALAVAVAAAVIRFGEWGGSRMSCGRVYGRLVG